jgi:type II secretory pathway pseudopilin PulG
MRARRILALVATVVALVAVGVTPAQASESALRERAHARIAAIMSDAVSSGIYSQSQSNYVTSALLPPFNDPKQLSAKAEQRTLDDFWGLVSEVRGVSVASAQSRLANGATLLRITGENSGDVQRSIYNWLSRPVVQAQLDGKISRTESATLRDDIARAVDRLMRQPGGSDGKVAVSPRRR